MTEAHQSNNENQINLSDFFNEIIKIISNRIEMFSHINQKDIIISITNNKIKPGNQPGKITLAKVIPLKFKDGAEEIIHKNKKYIIPRIIHNNRIIKYLIHFYMPYFFDLPLKEKIDVIFHELYHINENFNGDIRRMGKRKISHGSSMNKFNNNFKSESLKFYKIFKIYYSSYYDILKLTNDELHSKFNQVIFLKIKKPKPIVI